MTERTLKIKVDQTGNAEAGISTLAGKLGGLGTLAGGVALGGLALLGTGLVTSAKAAMEAEAGQVELQAVLASTGGKAGITADMVNNLASAFQATTRFSDDTILSGQNMLLTFTNIGKDVFPAATEAMLNMGQKFGSVDQASVMLGKALNDPIAGVTALRRVGVQLTDAQEAQIKKFMEVGNVAGAQKVILGELETEFGGLAVAAGSTAEGGMTILANKFGDIQEKIGAGVTPVLLALLPVISQFLDEIVIVGEQAMPVINDALTRMAQAFGVNTSKVTATDAIVKIFKLALDAVIIAIKLGTVAIKLLADGVEQGRRNFDAIKGAATSAGNTIKNMMNSIKSAVNSAISKIKDLANSIKAAASSIPDWLIPGSPTPFEIGLRGVASAAGDVAGKLPPAFDVPAAGGGILAGAGAGAGGGAAVVVQYSPIISTASQIEVESKLIPLIVDGLRKRGVKVG